MQVKRYEEALEGLGFEEAFLPGMIFSVTNNHSMSWEVFSKLRSLLVVNVKGTFQILVKKQNDEHDSFPYISIIFKFLIIPENISKS